MIYLGMEMRLLFVNEINFIVSFYLFYVYFMRFDIMSIGYWCLM